MLAYEQRGSALANSGQWLQVVPLFETVGDLDRAPQVVDKLLGLPYFRDYLRYVWGQWRQLAFRAESCEDWDSAVCHRCASSYTWCRTEEPPGWAGGASR